MSGLNNTVDMILLKYSQKTIGDLSNNNEHLLNHLDEGYLHGSILVNAMQETGYSNEGIGVHYQRKVVNSFKRAVRRYLQKRLLPNN